MQPDNSIQIRGVRVHNLKNVDVDIPLNRLTVITGISGSGKSSLAFDTLFVEGQRRYIDSFSASARQHLDRLEKPNVESVSRIPPAVAIRQVSTVASARSTIATATEIQRTLEMLFVRQGRLICPDCDLLVEQHDSASVSKWLQQQPAGARMQLGFRVRFQESSFEVACRELLNAGFSRALVSNVQGASSVGSNTTLSELIALDSATKPEDQQRAVFVIVDRVTVGKTKPTRLIEGIETCLASESGQCIVFGESDAVPDVTEDSIEIDGKHWRGTTFSASLACARCTREFRQPHVRDLNVLSPAGMCPGCAGAGFVSDVDLNQIVPDRTKSIESGAFAVFRDEKWAKEKDRFFALARDQGISLDKPIEQLAQDDIDLLVNGDPTEKTQRGIQAFLRRLERRTPTHELSLFLAQWRNVRVCIDCSGTRLNQLARGIRIRVAGAVDSIGVDARVEMSLPQFTELSIDDALVAVQRMRDGWPPTELAACRHLLSELENRLRQLGEIGLGYLPLNRAMRTLSAGEARRVELAAVLGSPLVHSLFVLDEPSAGLHPSDMAPVIDALHRLRDVGNTVVVVEHERRFVEAADFCIDIGPRAGQAGGEVVFAGEVGMLAGCEHSLTAQHLAKSNGAAKTEASRITAATKWIELRDAKFQHLDVSEVRFPLDCLCVVSGVSGSGKSSLVEHVLYPAVCQSLSKTCVVHERGSWSLLSSLEHISDVQFVDDSPLARNVRSNAATWLDVFPLIRRLFSETNEAQEKGFTAGHFSFNSDRGGRCPKCDGAGRLEVDMQFLADVVMTCPECSGARYRSEILQVTWRTRSIADVLAMTSSEAFLFFRGQPQIQRRLQPLKEVGLEYLTLGQPLSTLSGGEAQRLKLAACLGTTKNRSLILLNEPTRGLHPADVERLIECFGRLIAVGHSLIVIEHDIDMIRAADHVITLGPGAGPNGGRVVTG